MFATNYKRILYYGKFKYPKGNKKARCIYCSH
jgi:hypothetical protein